MNLLDAPHTSFTRMRDSTQADWQVIGGALRQFAHGLPDCVLTHLKRLGGDFGADVHLPVDRVAHSLQTATRALRDGRPGDHVVCVLLHDIGDTLGSQNQSCATRTSPPLSSGPLSVTTTTGWCSTMAFFRATTSFTIWG